MRELFPMKNLNENDDRLMKDEKMLNEFITNLKNINENNQSELSIYKSIVHQLIDQSPVGIYILGEESYTFVNSQYSMMLGYSKEELTSGNVKLNQIFHPDDFSEIQRNIQRRKNGEKTTGKYRVRKFKKDGSLIYIEIYATAAEVCGEFMMVGTVFDITEQVDAEMKLQESNERYESLFLNSPDAIFSFDDAGKFIEANPASESITGYTNEELLNMSFDKIIEPKDLPDAVAHFEKAKNGVSTSADLRIMQKGSGIIHINATHFPKKVNGIITGTYGMARDITTRKLLDQQLEMLAFYDPLTNLPNRQLFEDRLNQLIHVSEESQRKYAVVFINLNRFKFINDSLGHYNGDEFLRLFANKLKKILRKSDTLSRFAGDEFTLLLPDVTQEEVIKLVEHINEEIMKEPFLIDGHSMTVSASIGIAFNNGKEDTALDLIRNADTAVYYTKKHKISGYTIYSEELDSKAAYKLTVEQDLQHAIHNNELELYYQPIMNLKTNTMCSVEALIRWHHPKLGLISPFDFIPIAEESGQIISVGKWVLQTACQQTKAWQDLGIPPFKTAVNISTKQLQQTDFVEMVLNTLQESNLHPKWLEIEVTESILLEDVGVIKESLLKLKSAGISISIDDFGTGYTSLSYLQQYPFDKVKIDRSFIEDINKDLNGKRITSAIISLAHSLNMQVVAEGIEDDVQLEYLQTEMCDEGQGYLFSKPVPVASLSFEHLGIK